MKKLDVVVMSTLAFMLLLAGAGWTVEKAPEAPLMVVRVPYQSEVISVDGQEVILDYGDYAGEVLTAGSGAAIAPRQFNPPKGDVFTGARINTVGGPDGFWVQLAPAQAGTVQQHEAFVAECKKRFRDDDILKVDLHYGSGHEFATLFKESVRLHVDSSGHYTFQAVTYNKGSDMRVIYPKDQYHMHPNGVIPYSFRNMLFPGYSIPKEFMNPYDPWYQGYVTHFPKEEYFRGQYYAAGWYSVSFWLFRRVDDQNYKAIDYMLSPSRLFGPSPMMRYPDPEIAGYDPSQIGRAGDIKPTGIRVYSAADEGGSITINTSVNEGTDYLYTVILKLTDDGYAFPLGDEPRFFPWKNDRKDIMGLREISVTMEFTPEEWSKLGKGSFLVPIQGFEAGPYGGISGRFSEQLGWNHVVTIE